MVVCPSNEHSFLRYACVHISLTRSLSLSLTEWNVAVMRARISLCHASHTSFDMMNGKNCRTQYARGDAKMAGKWQENENWQRFFFSVADLSSFSLILLIETRNDVVSRRFEVKRRKEKWFIRVKCMTWKFADTFHWCAVHPYFPYICAHRRVSRD